MTRALTRVRELFAALRRRPRLLKTLELIAGVVVVGLCTWSVSGEWSKAWPELRHAHPGYVALAFGTVAIYYLVFILGWIRILAAWGMNVPYIPRPAVGDGLDAGQVRARAESGRRRRAWPRSRS